MAGSTATDTGTQTDLDQKIQTAVAAAFKEYKKATVMEQPQPQPGGSSYECGCCGVAITINVGCPCGQPGQGEQGPPCVPACPRKELLALSEADRARVEKIGSAINRSPEEVLASLQAKAIMPLISNEIDRMLDELKSV